MSGPPRSHEVRALARLGFTEAGHITRDVELIHRAISDRVFTAIGPASAPTKVVADGITRVAYGGVRTTMSLGGAVTDRILRERNPGNVDGVSTSVTGSKILSAIHGLIGDELEREDSQLHEPMSIRAGGHAVEMTPRALADAFPRDRGHIAVFVHGLATSEHAWNFAAGRSGGSYGARLEREYDITPVYVRYNTGRHVSENAQSLDELLERMAAAWPVPPATIALIGHSMGGLVARSASHHADLRDAAWVRRVRTIVSLGSPNAGAPLEQLVHVASAALNVVPETRPFAAFLRRRSAGIRDLGHGALLDRDWRDRNPDALGRRRVTPVPLLKGATHGFVAGTITQNRRHPIGRVLGDWLVRESSALPAGIAQSEDVECVHIGGAHHIALLNHPQVYAQLRLWMTRQLEGGNGVRPNGRSQRRRAKGSSAGLVHPESAGLMLVPGGTI